MTAPVAAGGEGQVARAQAAASGFSFFAASAKNFFPRIVSAAAMATVTGVYVGWAWAVPWFLVILCSLWSNHALVQAMGRAATPQKARRIWRISNASSFVFTCLQCAPIVALWFTAKPPAMGFAILGSMIGSTYVLLQYYAEPLQFRLFLTPYATALAIMGWRLIVRSNYETAGLVTGLAAVVALFNFFHFSRLILANSRTALRAAKAKAQEKEIAAEAANRAKSAFLATMSHEIRTPLNGVLGMAQAMAAEELTALQRDRLSVIHRSGESLLAILNDLLDLSKIEAGKLELEAIEFDLGEVARGAHSAFTALANKKGLSFCLDVEQAAGRYQGDPTRLRQILYNLISNALKFTEQGEIRVTASRDGDTLTLAVRDTGLGISPENLSKLFGKFDQLDSSTTRRFGGTGLGLSICRELAHLMDGDIAVESVLGQGSCFTLRVNLPRVGDAKPPAALAPAAPADLKSSALRVLAAEDNTVNQLVLKTLLHQLGLDPTIVDNGQAAVEAWETAEWDVILMDIQMPVMDGLTAATTIRAREIETARPRTPIIALTANAMSHQVDQYLSSGMDGHVAKPIEAAALFGALCAVTGEVEYYLDDEPLGAAVA